MSNSKLIIATLYPEVDTLDEMKHIILRTMGVVGQKYVRRIQYILLDILPPLEYKFKLFWLEGDDHVRAMFDMHHRYGPRQVMELLTERRNVGRSNSGASNSRSGLVGAIVAPPLRIATQEVSMELDLDNGSDEEYLGVTDDSSDRFEEAQYVAGYASTS
ncbi:hypothetical protein PIB30_037905 [Stylosanthes scabra]|uniref:Uncharacterized protein n=1 Tax=Stylosanthes scabra TaxID=79078 RepID=A0ABU6QFD4_9FABA|nr:hypothetical protein [Stylosanthes scabra]